MAETKQLRVFVTEENAEGSVPKVCELEAPVGVTWQDLNEAVSEVVLGPAEERWTKVLEKRKEDINPDTGGGSITITSTWQSHRLSLWTHPHDDCAPCRSVAPQEVPPAIDLYRMLDPDCPAPEAVDGEGVLAGWWAAMPKGRNALRPLLLKRLVAKASLPAVYTWLESRGEGEDAYQMQRKEPLPYRLREKVVLEGVKGLWELCADKDWAMRLNAPCLQALVDALTGGMPAPMEVAAKAVWSLAALSAPRSALVQLDVVAALCSAIAQAVALRRTLEAARGDGAMEGSAAPAPAEGALPEGVTLEILNRVVHACLGALGVLGVDASARQAALKVSPSLDLLLQLSELEFIVPEPILPPMLPMSVSAMPSDFNQSAEDDADMEPLTPMTDGGEAVGPAIVDAAEDAPVMEEGSGHPEPVTNEGSPKEEASAAGSGSGGATSGPARRKLCLIR